MKRILVVLFVFCAVCSWAQEPLLSTRWTQEAPYNQYCPADPLEDNEHSYAGCPAVVMGQILNYLRTTQGTRFNDFDDYYTGNYFGRQFHIDDDWDFCGFPSFPQLNVLLDSVDARFQRGEEFADSLSGAVIFDCATAYIGSANLTGAGMGMKGDNNRNFEAGILTDEPALVDAAADHLDSVWQGHRCTKCKRKNFCGDRIV